MNKNKIFIFAVLFLANSLLTHASNNNEDEIRKTNIPNSQQTQPKNGGNQKVGQNNVDVGDVNFDGKFGAGNNKKNKNKNKGGGKKNQ